MAGRPTKYTKEVAQKVTAALRVGATCRLAAQYAGIGEATLTRWRKRYSDFDAQCASAEAAGAMTWLAVIDQAAPGDWRAAAWKLERRYPQEYGPRVKVDVEQQVRAIAQQYGLNPDEAVEEAERLLAEAKERNTRARTR